MHLSAFRNSGPLNTLWKVSLQLPHGSVTYVENAIFDFDADCDMHLLAGCGASFTCTTTFCGKVISNVVHQQPSLSLLLSFLISLLTSAAHFSFLLPLQPSKNCTLYQVNLPCHMRMRSAQSLPLPPPS